MELQLLGSVCQNNKRCMVGSGRGDLFGDVVIAADAVRPQRQIGIEDSRQSVIRGGCARLPANNR